MYVMHTCRKATITLQPHQLSTLSLHYLVADYMENLKKYSKILWLTFKRICIRLTTAENHHKIDDIMVSLVLQRPAEGCLKLRNTSITSRRPQLCTNLVSGRSMQKPVRLSRDADRRTDRWTAFLLYIVCIYIYIYIYI